MSKKYDLNVNFILPRYQIKEHSLQGIQLGGTLEGEVVMVPFEDVNCRGVWVEIGYHGRGKGSPYTNKLSEKMVYQGKLVQNQPVSHQILFTIPYDSPVTYQGDYVTIDWYVQVRIDIPFWFDVREEFPFRVLPCFAEDINDINLDNFGKVPDDGTPFPW